MLIEFLEKAHAMCCDSIEIEYEDGKRLITACQGNLGMGIGWVKEVEAKHLFKEIDAMKKKQVSIAGAQYRLAVSRYQNFDEWVWRVRMKQKSRTTPSKRNRSLRQV
jgi:hypothetical protein